MTDRPKLEDYPQTAEGIARWGRERKAYFDNLKRRERQPRPAMEPRVIYRDRVVEKRVEVPVENTEKLTNLERALREARAKLDEREAAPVPESLKDLIDPSLTAREQHDKLIEKYRDAKNLEEMARAAGDKSEMMIQLNKAQRLESGIAWNRARLTEQI